MIDEKHMVTQFSLRSIKLILIHGSNKYDNYVNPYMNDVSDSNSMWLLLLKKLRHETSSLFEIHYLSYKCSVTFQCCGVFCQSTQSHNFFLFFFLCSFFCFLS